MKNDVIICLIAALSFIFTSCHDDNVVVDYQYHSHIHQPSSADKHIGDILFIDVVFESHSGEKVEHINIKIYNKATLVVVYNEPDDPHVAQGADYEFHDQFVLDAPYGFTAGIYVLQATVWEWIGQDQIVETVEFEILP